MRPVPTRRIVKRSRLGFGQGNQLIERMRGHRGMNNQNIFGKLVAKHTAVKSRTGS